MDTNQISDYRRSLATPRVRTPWGRLLRGEVLNSRRGVLIAGMLSIAMAVLLAVMLGGSSDEVLRTTPGQAKPAQRTMEIVTILPKDAIRAIFNPTFIGADEAAGRMLDDDLVIGLSINGDHRAYSVPFLSRREIVNDVVGGMPVAVTW